MKEKKRPDTLEEAAASEALSMERI